MVRCQIRSRPYVCRAPGTAHGLTLYVSPAHTPNGHSAIFDSTSQIKLLESEVVLGVLGTGLGETKPQEICIFR